MEAEPIVDSNGLSWHLVLHLNCFASNTSNPYTLVHHNRCSFSDLVIATKLRYTSFEKSVLIAVFSTGNIVLTHLVESRI
jgi:hypothetical protein